MGPDFRIDGAACLIGALSLLLLPLNWLMPVLAAAGIHEGCHYLTARWMQVPVFQLRIGWDGCRMITGPMTAAQELQCAAAGPLGSLLLVFLSPWCPRLAVCAGLQGLFNLLPVYPLDGGRILMAIAGKQRTALLSQLTGYLALLAGGYLWLSKNLGPLPLILGLTIYIKSVKIKYFLQTGQTHSTIGLPIFKR